MSEPTVPKLYQLDQWFLTLLPYSIPNQQRTLSFSSYDKSQKEDQFQDEHNKNRGLLQKNNFYETVCLHFADMQICIFSVLYS